MEVFEMMGLRFEMDLSQDMLWSADITYMTK